jgi:hypothetical protein
MGCRLWGAICTGCILPYSDRVDPPCARAGATGRESPADTLGATWRRTQPSATQRLRQLAAASALGRCCASGVCLAKIFSSLSTAVGSRTGGTGAVVLDGGQL